MYGRPIGEKFPKLLFVWKRLYLNDNFSGLSISFFSLSVLNMSFHSFLASKLSADKSTDCLIRTPLYLILLLSLAVLKTLSLIFESLIITCLGEDIFVFSVFGESLTFTYLNGHIVFYIWEIQLFFL